MTCGGHFDIPSKKERISELEGISLQTDFWSDRDTANKTIDEMN